MKETTKLKDQALLEINSAPDLKHLEQIRVNYLGKKGKLTEQLKTLGKLPAEERPKAGQVINDVKILIQNALEDRKDSFKNEQLKEAIDKGSVDVSLPGKGVRRAGLHPITLTMRRIESLFEQIGFDVVDGPEVEDEYHNFEALNIPEHHPARAMHDTFYFEDGRLLRTHTSLSLIHI